ncbi:MAG: Gfo/Idh/MocA family oxidoreductase, partial [Myxococcales bacterium]|nr:Gfo/Idh/MocA family oxidoreductase [Myxococcales bacterium]
SVTNPIRIGVAGCGHWGPNHLRNFHEAEDTELVAAADLDSGRLAGLTARYPELRTTTSAEELVTSPDLDAVVVSTPTSTHYDLCALALRSGKHVLCEKPICVRSEDGTALVAMADELRRILMVGHVFLFNPGILRTKELLTEGVCGSVRYLDFIRTNLGPIRQDVDVMYDLATHDIAIANFLLGEEPTRVSATSGIFLQRELADVAFLHLEYPSGVLANIHVSWLNPKKVRNMTIVGSERMLTWNEFGVPGPVEIYDRSVLIEEPSYRDYGEFQLKLQEGDVQIPRVVGKEPLQLQAQEFIRAIRTGQAPRSDGRFGVSVLKVLEAAQGSSSTDSRFTKVAWGSGAQAAAS